MNLIFKINQPDEIVFEYLSNMQKFAEIHPVITKIEPTGTNRYLVYETLTFGLIPFSFTYPVLVEHNFEKKTVCMKATVMRVAEIEITFKIREEKGLSVVEEEIEFRSFLPIKSAMGNIFKKQHEQLFQNMEGLT